MEPWGARLAQGGEAEFAEFYDACADRLHAYLAVRLGCREDAADVLQETFVRLVRNRTKLRQVDNVVAYAFTIARNEAARLAKKTTRERIKRLEASQRVAQQASDTSQIETVELVAAALARLVDDEREVIALKTYGDLTFAEIAKVTKLPQGTVATRYRAGIERLRRLLARELS